MGHVCINFYGTAAAMPEQLLYEPKVSSIFQKMCGKAVA